MKKKKLCKNCGHEVVEDRDICETGILAELNNKQEDK